MAHRDGVVLDVDERPEFGQWVGLSLRHMFSSLFNRAGADSG